MTAEYAVGPILIKPAERRVLLHGQPLALGARAFDLLLALLERRDRVVAKSELMALVWPGLVVEDGNLAVQISTLRKLLGGSAVTTVAGRGYRFTAPVVAQMPDAEPAALRHEPVVEQRGFAGAAAPTPAPQAYERLMLKLRRPSIADASGNSRNGEPQPDLGPEPSAEAAAQADGWLPLALTPLLGRDKALAETQALLQTSRCLSLTGAGGAGKTRLAQALAEAARAQYPGGCWWVGLDTLGDAGLLAHTLARAVGCADLRQGALQALQQRLQGRKALLVLDNCEHLIEGCADVALQLLLSLPDLHLLNTSREALRIAGEVVWSVPPLDTPGLADDQRLGELLQNPSIQLLLQRIGQHSPGFALTQDNAASLVRICRGLDGLPLALELVAAQVGPRTPAEVAAGLDRSLALLRVGPRGGMPHHQTMAAAIDWGYQLLDDTERALFLRLSVFEGGCTLDSAASACEDLGLDADELPEVVGRLYRASMLLAAEAGGTMRFRMLEPIRQFAFAQLQALGLVDAVKHRWMAWTLVRCQSVAAQLGGSQQAQGYAFLACEFDNLRALLQWSKQHEVVAGVSLATELWRFWQVKGHAKEMLDWFDEVLPQAPQLPKPLRAAACNSAGVMARTCGRYASAAALHTQAIALQRELGNRKGEATALNNLCVIARDQYDHAAVEQHGRASLALAREIGEKNLEGLALMHLGTALRGQDRPADAEVMFKQSFAIFSEMGELRAQGTLLNFLGRLALDDGRWPEAERCFNESLELNRELEDFWGLGISTCNLAALHAARGDDETALQMLLRSLVHYRRAGARHGVEDCFELLAMLAHRRGRLQRAAWCWGVVDQLERDVGKLLSPATKARREPTLHTLKTEMPGEVFSTARAEGLRVTLEEAFGTVLPEGGME